MGARAVLRDAGRVMDMSFPEVESVFAKAGRVETATDPAPLVMVETIINLKTDDEGPSSFCR